jgi:Polysaccharide deacetylase
MSARPGPPEPTPDEIRRRRTIAVGVLLTAFALFVIAVVSALGGGDDDAEDRRAEQRTQTTQRPARRPRRPARPARTPPGGVPANAPGAHRAPDEAVPILTYRVINTPRPDTGNPDEWVPAEEFQAQMSYLAQQGYHPVTLRQVWAAWKEGGLLPSKPIVISFDTGYHSVYANALPVLRARGWPGTLFLAPSQLEADFPATEVKALLQAGWELDAKEETQGDAGGLAEARRRLQQEFGGRVEFFSYADEVSDQLLSQEAESAGFLGAVTGEEGLAEPDEPPFELDRIEVLNGFGEQGLAQALQAAGAG